MEKGHVFVRGRAFTLIELLVVISILSLLVALLLPALAKVREVTLSTMCLSNFRQVGITTSMYSQTYKSYLPPVGDAAWYFKEFTGGDLGRGTIFFCPAADGQSTVAGDRQYPMDWGGPFYSTRQWTYAFNYHMRGAQNTENENNAIKILSWWVGGPQIREHTGESAPSDVMWGVDASSHRFDASFGHLHIPAFRHGGEGPGIVLNWQDRGALSPGFNMSYLDGHASWTVFREWDDWRSDMLNSDAFAWR